MVFEQLSTYYRHVLDIYICVVEWSQNSLILLTTKLWKWFCCYSGAEQREERKSVLFRSPTGNKGKQTPSRSAPEASGMQIWVSKSSPFFLPFLHILLLSFSTAPTSSQHGLQWFRHNDYLQLRREDYFQVRFAGTRSLYEHIGLNAH